MDILEKLERKFPAQKNVVIRDMYCRTCNYVGVIMKYQVFRNKMIRIRGTCKKCGKFQGFKKQKVDVNKFTYLDMDE